MREGEQYEATRGPGFLRLASGEMTGGSHLRGPATGSPVFGSLHTLFRTTILQSAEESYSPVYRWGN